MPDNLIAGLNGETQVLFSVPNGFQAERLENVSGVTAVHQRNQHITVSGNGPPLANVAAALANIISPRPTSGACSKPTWKMSF